MLIEEVKKMDEFHRYCYFVNERENVRIKREDKEYPPWTDDYILQHYRFCNIIRIEDRVSQWLMKNWYKPFFDHSNMVVACTLARFFNKPETLGLITKYVFPDKNFGQGQLNAIKNVIRARKSEGYPVFNGAYMVRGNDGDDKISSVVDYYVEGVRKLLYYPASMEATWMELKACHGFGSFMAGQIVADLRWATSGAWEDKNEWAPKGPGSQRGLNRLAGERPNKNIPQQEFLEELTTLKKLASKKLPKALTDRMEMMDWQNSLCEFDKHERALCGQGKPKQLYRKGL